MPTGYFALFLWCLLSGIAIPLPEDVPQVWAGMRIASGEMTWAPALAVAMVGVLLRDSLFFGLGRALGDRVFGHPVLTRIVPASRLEAARRRVAARGGIAVLVARFSVGVRSATFLVAGAMGVRPRDFLLWDAAAMLVSVPVIVGLGYAFGEPVALAIEWAAARARWVVPLLMAVGVVAWLGWGRVRAARPAPG